MTVLFCDLVDSTRLSRQLDPEDYWAVIRAYQKAAVAAIQPFDGYVAQYLGDGLLLYFGWPQAHEDAALRAVYASLAMLDALGPLHSHLEPQYGVRVAVRLSLHTGLVVIGAMGSGTRQEALAMGDTPNMAARIQGLAGPNTVVLSATTARLVQGAFTLEELGAHHLKGVTESMPVFRVIGPLETYRDEVTAVPAPVPFLVGRNEEIGLLRRRWEQSKEGLGQVVLISGEAGIGKSTLVQALRAHVGREDVTWIMCRCSPYHTNSVLYPVIEHLQRALRWQSDDPAAVKLDKLEQALRTSCLPLQEAVPLLAALLSVPYTERYSPPALTPQQQKQQTLDTLVAWLAEEVERQPVLAVWDDLHWADPTTLELLGLFIDQAPTVPMLHVLTFRPVFVPPWPTRSHMTPLTLTRLERPQVEALITHLAGGKSLPAEVVQPIVAKTDGVPLFVEELIKMLLESELLREEAEHYWLRREIQAAHEWNETLLAHANEQGFPTFVAAETALRGLALAMRGQVETGTAQGREALTLAYEASNLSWPISLLLAEVYRVGGQAEEGLRLLAEALAVVDKTGVRHLEAEIYRLQGVLLLAQSSDTHAAAETCLSQALTITRRQQAKAWELRAATSLSRLWQQQGKQEEAQQLLATVYSWFTEGLDTTDLQEARALLDARTADAAPTR